LNALCVMMMQSQWLSRRGQNRWRLSLVNWFVRDEDSGLDRGVGIRGSIARDNGGDRIMALVMRPRRFCSMIAAAMLKVLPAPTACAT